MSDKALMLELPEVRHLVDLVPIARYAIKPSAVQLRFFAHARDTRMPIKRQCALLGVPWHARRVPAALAGKAVLKLARQLEPTVFVQTMPATKYAFERWRDTLVEALAFGVPDAKLTWLAFHAVEIPDEHRHEIVSYLCNPAVPAPTHRTAAKTVLRRIDRRPQTPFETLMIDRYLDALNQQMGRNVLPPLPANPVIEYPPGWLEPFVHGPFSVQLLRTYDEFVVEGRLMRNCVAQYFYLAQRGECRIASVRRDGQPVADVEFNADWLRAQLRGPNNAPVTDPEIFEAVEVFRRRFVPERNPVDSGAEVAMSGQGDASPARPLQTLLHALFPTLGCY